MKKAGDFRLTDIERTKEGVFPAYLVLELSSNGKAESGLFDEFFEGKEIRVAAFVIPDGENSDDYELVKRSK